MPRTRSIPGPLLALLAAPAVATATISVAAADAPAEVRAAADFVCDGVDDQLEINCAFDALPWDGGTVRLSAGTFRCADNVVPGAYTTIEGAGTGATTVAISGYYHAIKVDRPYVTIRDLRITDRAWVRITASHVRVENVLAEDDLHGYYPGVPVQVTVAVQVPVPQTSRWYVPACWMATVDPPGYGPATVVESVTPQGSLM